MIAAAVYEELAQILVDEADRLESEMRRATPKDRPSNPEPPAPRQSERSDAA
jgi:hypothetical protein